MTDKLEPLNMEGHANTYEEELIEVVAERNDLRAEVERLRAQNEWLVGDNYDMSVTWVALAAERANALAEVERLRAAKPADEPQESRPSPASRPRWSGLPR